MLLHQTALPTAKHRDRKSQAPVVWQQRGRLGYPSRMIPSLDDLIGTADAALRTLSGAVHAARPAPEARAEVLDDRERRRSGALMRVNHVGEVCAQALYQAQALTSRSPELRARMDQAAREETDHLAWTLRRLEELGDRISLGFVVETERQVEQHLDGHLDRLPAGDHASRAIVQQMKEDEARHADAALAAGGASLPAPVRWLMRAASRVMTTTAYRL